MTDGGPDKTVSYFAFGANMASEVIARRQLKPLTACAARLDNYALRFNLPGIPIYEPGFANIEPQDGVSTWGVLYTLTPQDFDRLAVAEGDGDHYEALEFEVTPAGKPGVATRARAFQALDTDPTLRPSKRYMGLLVRGAREHRLPTSYVDFLKATPYVEPPLGEVVMPHVLRLLDWMFEHGIAPNAAIERAWKVRNRLRAFGKTRTF